MRFCVLAGLYWVTENAALLAEAIQKFPNDPQVAFEAAFKTRNVRSPPNAELTDVVAGDDVHKKPSQVEVSAPRKLDGRQQAFQADWRAASVPY